METAQDQLNYEKEGALRFTIFQPMAIDGSSCFVVNFVEGFKDHACFKAHIARKDVLRMRNEQSMMQFLG
jgi:quinol monooxygenase YgiN